MTNYCIVTNPANREWLRNRIASVNDGRLSDLTAIQIVFEPAIEDRDIRQEWSPPPPERFVEYGTEDEGWMRPLGLGTVRTVDKGPLFYFVDTGAFFRKFGYRIGDRVASHEWLEKFRVKR